MNPPFPEAAESVRQKIIELVKKPNDLPAMDCGSLRWMPNDERCPVILAYYANGERAFTVIGSCSPFYQWWDRCNDAQQAVDTVWGKEA